MYPTHNKKGTAPSIIDEESNKRSLTIELVTSTELERDMQRLALGPPAAQWNLRKIHDR